jgi:hypothetical protein
LEPDYFAAARALGQSLVRSGQIAKAMQFYGQEMIALPAFAPQAHLERGRLRAASGDLAGSEQDFQAVTRPDGQRE